MFDEVGVEAFPLGCSRTTRGWRPTTSMRRALDRSSHQICIDSDNRICSSSAPPCRTGFAPANDHGPSRRSSVLAISDTVQRQSAAVRLSRSRVASSTLRGPHPAHVEVAEERDFDRRRRLRPRRRDGQCRRFSLQHLRIANEREREQPFEVQRFGGEEVEVHGRAVPQPKRKSGTPVQDEGLRNTGKRRPKCALLVGQHVEPGYERHRGNGLTGNSGTGTQPSRRCQYRHERPLKAPTGGSRSTARKSSSETRESSQRTSSTLPRVITWARKRRLSARVRPGGCHQTYFLAMACARRSFAGRSSGSIGVALKSTPARPTTGQ